MADSDDTLVQFRAGLMRPQNNTLKADQRKGLVRLIQADDGLLHFRWYERTGPSTTVNAAEQDVIIFPGEAKFNKVGNAGPNSRIYTLDFPSDKTRALFFWMQEPKQDGDAQLTEQVNQVLSTNFGEADEASEMEQDDDAEAGAVDALLQAAGNQAQGAQSQSGGFTAADLARMLSGVSGTPQPSTSGQSQPSTQPQPPSQPQPGAITAADLASVLRNIGVPSNASGSGGNSEREQQAAAALAQMARASGPSLAEVLKPEVVIPLLQEPGMLEQLAPHLPEEHRHMEGLLAVATSSQWRHQLDIFSNALQTGQLDVSAFGLKFLGFSVADFLQSIQNQADAEREQAKQDKES